MKEYTTWIHIILGILLAASACCALALFGDSIRRAVASFSAIFTGPLAAVQANCARWVAAVRGWLAGQVADENDRKEDGPVYFIIGAVVYSILTLVFMFCDWGMIILTAEGMGLDTARFELPMDTSSLTATTLVTAALFWGSVFFDALGVTRIAPWHKAFSPAGRRVIIAVSLAFLILAVAIAGVMAYWRGDMLAGLVPEAEAGTTESGIEAGGLDLGTAASGFSAVTAGPETTEAQFSPDALRRQEQMVKFSLVGLAVLSGGSTAFSMVGVMKLAKFVILAAIGITSLPLLFVQGLTWLLVTVLNFFLNAIYFVIEVPMNIGTAILRAFGVKPVDPGATAPISGDPAGAVGNAAAPPMDEAPAGAEEAGFNPFARR